jgi:N-acetylmuramoyl-L-alanine amidase
MEVRKHLLYGDDGSAVSFEPTPNIGGVVSAEYLVMHYTAGASAKSSIEWFLNPAARASSHLVIARSGSITQLVPFDRVAWHAGQSRWGNRVGLNAWSLGIELDNAGELVRHPDGWQTKWGRPIPDSEVFEGAHKNGGPATGWHAYTVEQLEIATRVAAVLVSHYRLLDVVGHDEIAPGRKTDPGPAFPMSSFRAAAVGRSDDGPAQGDFVTTTDLNIRVGPGSQFAKLAASPLPKGTRLARLGTHEAWLNVHVLGRPGGDMDLEGWVHGGYVEPAASGSQETPAGARRIERKPRRRPR